MLGQIKNIEEIYDFKIAPVSNWNDLEGQLGMSQSLSVLSGYSLMDGYKVVTDKHTYHVLIDNGQSCCENWGYMVSEDDLSDFINAELKEVRLTDTALNQAKIDEEIPYGFDEGGIQFIDFITDNGIFQITVYNAHNGYYGHGIVVAKDDEIILSDVL